MPTTGSTNVEALVMNASAAPFASSTVNDRSSIAIWRSRASFSTTERVMPCRISLPRCRVTTTPPPVTMYALFELPSVTKPSSTIQASSAPASSAACFAIDAASSPTVFTSRCFQRTSGTVTIVIPRAARGLSTSAFLCVNITSVGFGSAGYAKSRSAGPRVICR